MRTWPKTLDECLEQPVEPVCPSFCAFNTMCPTWVQQGTNQNFIDGKFTKREQCMWYQRLAGLVVADYGMEPPVTSDELMELMAERIGMRGTA